jgi:ABC-type nitrate/sulfonate/bicarbonate transport system permease component
MSPALFKAVIAVVFTLLVIAIWQAAVDFGLANRLFVAAPSKAFGVIVERAEDGSLWSTIAATAQRMFTGWIAAIAVAMALGIAVGNSETAHQFLSPTLEFFRPLPASAVIPVAILFFGLSTTMSTFVIAFGSLWPILLAAIHGFVKVPRELREVASTLEMSKLRYILTIAIPSASVDIMAGLRISLALALILTVVTEMQASLSGLGYEIFLAQRTFRTADLYAGLMTIGAFGFLINQLLLLAERRLMRWKAA